MTTFQVIGAGIYYNVQQTSTVRTFLTSANNVSSRTLPGPIALMKTKITVAPAGAALDKKIKTYTRVLLSPDVSGTSSSASSAGSSALAKATNVSSYSDLFDTSSAPEPFRRNGYVNSMLPNLGFSIVIILLTGIWYFLASAFLFGKVTVKSGCFKRFFAFNAERSFYTCMMFGSLELAVFSMNNLLNPKFDHAGHILSFVCALLTVMVLVALPVILYNIANHYTITLWNPEYYQRYGFIYCEFKLDSKLRKAFMAVLMARIIIFGFVMAALARNPVPQTICAFMIHLIYFAVMIKTKPFVSMIMFVTAIIAGTLCSGRILYHGLGSLLHRVCRGQRAEGLRLGKEPREAGRAQLRVHHDRHPGHHHRHHDHDHPQARPVPQKTQVRKAVQKT
jgi:Transient receptor potential (TRP) ion channel